MDKNQFDDLTRGLAGMRTRRGVLKALGGALLGAISGGASLDGASAAAPKKCKYQGSSCKSNTECCTLNCCNRVCCGDGQVCCHGQCVYACPAGQAMNASCQCVSTAPACASAADCPRPANDCQMAICVGGQCGTTSVPNGAPCDDGNLCTRGDSCLNGTCVGGAVKSCAASDQCHAPGVCNPNNGLCSNPNASDGTPCDDGDACTTGDACQAGVCTGGSPVACDPPGVCQVSVACDSSTGTCVAVNKADGASCGAGTACSDQVCQAGQCVSKPKATGAACSDHDNCTSGDACDGQGNCVAGAPVTCPPSDACHGSGACDEASGQCGANPLLSGWCSIGGVCFKAGDPEPGNVCKVCDPSQSTSAFSFAPDITVCDDGNACTTGDHCSAGACVGGTAKSCVASDQCHLAGTCNPMTGVCSNPDASDTTPCDLPNAASAACFAGICQVVTCDAGYGDCNKQAGGSDGCETKTDSDVANCGACGNVCNPTNGTPTCSGGVCGITCNAGFDDCDNDPKTGCETELNTVTNCGGCGVVCPGYQLPNDNVACQAGSCTFSCQGEHYDVDNNPSNGCEVADNPIGNHTQDSAYNLGTPSNCDLSNQTLSGQLPSDRRVHATPSIVGFDQVSGSAPDWFVVHPDTSGFCSNDLNFTLQMNGSASPACYRLTVVAGGNTYVAQTDGSGQAGIHRTSGQYADGSYVYFSVSKTCDTSVIEAPTYTISYRL